MKKGIAIFACWLLLLPADQAGAQQRELARIDHIHRNELRLQGFHLSSAQRVDIEAAGLHQSYRDRELILGTGWILDARSRQVVWEMPPLKSHLRGREIQEIHTGVELPAGDYEAYYAAYPYFEGLDWHGRSAGANFGGFIARLARGLFDGHFDWSADDPAALDDFRLIIRGAGQPLQAVQLREMQEELRRTAAISFAATRNDAYFRQGFELTQPTTLHIYALGEAREDGDFDYGWIINTATREKVWMFTYYDSEPAGGASKNRMADQTVNLAPGRYAAVYLTDGSHSPQEWNSPPPADPAFWGLTISPEDREAQRHIRLVDDAPFSGMKEVVALRGLGDNEFASGGFSLKKTTRLFIYALGEGRDDEMFDYGWIVEAGSNRRVWEMHYRETEHGGGSGKNRLFDGAIDLEPGNYLAYFLTDGSHSSGNWNASPPFDPAAWGMAVHAPEAEFDGGNIGDYRPEDDPNLLAQIVRVGDHAFEQKRFTLDQETMVRIYALGEGSGGEMYDYAWLRDDRTGETVWRMTYDRTEHAGGAGKNREIEETRSLPAGEYTLYYESDGSHSFNDWNDSPPRDPVHWGVTVFRVRR